MKAIACSSGGARNRLGNPYRYAVALWCVTRANTAFDFQFFDVERHVEKTGKKPLLFHFARSPAVAADPSTGGQVACLTRRQAFLLRRDGILGTEIDGIPRSILLPNRGFSWFC